MKKFTFEPSFNVNTYDPENPKEIEHHFFGTNAAEWKVATDFKEVYDWFLKQDYEFSIHFVPRHPKTPYEIHFGRPVGVDAHWLGSYIPTDKNKSGFSGRKRNEP